MPRQPSPRRRREHLEPRGPVTAHLEEVVKIVGDNIARESRLHTDESKLYHKIGKEFVAIVAAQQEYRFREPGFEGGCHAAFDPEKKVPVQILARSKPGWPSDETDVCLEGNLVLTSAG